MTVACHKATLRYSSVTGQSSLAVVALRWAYVVARGIHSIIHLTSNKVLWRSRIYGLSWVALVALMVTVLAGLITR